jgi:hypothetical protein
VILARLPIERPGAKLHLTKAEFCEWRGCCTRDPSSGRGRNMAPPTGRKHTECKKTAPPAVNVI